ncbi:DUF2384 domain-containing protein [Rhizobium leguminosarum bv. viciae]|nr:antitoxin Xre/MbcA/ParS toxin-binding domain-containing protein [Rhizobium leguminosarum]TBZ09846.1 DUF2384 domain-containing protein [Rhizobium leguminosarum bv. viciae]
MQVVLVTNDTDLVPALEMLQARCPHIVRGLVIPTRKVGTGGELEREANVSLAKLAHWVRRHISDHESRTSQLPDVVPGRRRASVKPHSWYAKPHHLAKMLEMARPVLRTEGEVLKWARRESAHLGGRRPIDLIETDAGAVEVFDYIEAYVREQLDKAGDQDDLSSSSADTRRAAWRRRDRSPRRCGSPHWRSSGHRHRPAISGGACGLANTALISGSSCF